MSRVTPLERAKEELNTNFNHIKEELNTCWVISSFKKPGVKYVVVKGYERTPLSQKRLIQIKSEAGPSCMIYSNASVEQPRILRSTAVNKPVLQTEIGCSCKDFLYRTYPSKYNKRVSPEVFHEKCKHMEYIQLYNSIQNGSFTI